MSSEIKYSKRLIVFIDILGFRSYLEDSSKLTLLVEQLKNIKKNFSGTYKFAQQLKFEVIQLSDSIIISIETNYVWDTMEALEKISIQACDSLVKYGIFFRGAITYGDFYHQDGILVSPAVSKAYEIESTIAKYPRIIISDEFIDLYKHQVAVAPDYKDFGKQAIEDLIKVDSEGFKYLHYLNSAMIRLNDQSAVFLRTDEAKLLEYLPRHKYLIEEKLEENKNNQKVLEKYVWLASYHNKYIKSLRHRMIYPDIVEFVIAGKPIEDQSFSSLNIEQT